MATTRLGQIGVGLQPYAGFAPKADASTGTHNPGVITRLGQCGIGLARYGTFLPKGAAVVVADQYSGGYRDTSRRRKEGPGRYPVSYFERETDEQRAERIKQDRIRFGVIPDDEAIRARAEAERAAQQRRTEAAAEAARQLRARAPLPAPRVTIEPPRAEEPIQIDAAELALNAEDRAAIRRDIEDEYTRRAIALILMAAASN